MTGSVAEMIEPKMRHSERHVGRLKPNCGSDVDKHAVGCYELALKLNAGAGKRRTRGQLRR